MTLTTLTNVASDRVPPLSFRNRFINGHMGWDQRNVGAAYTNANGVTSYLCDRFYIYQTGNTMATQRITNWATTPNPDAIQLTGKASINAVYFGQKIESMNIYDTVGNTVTVQCKIASSSLANINWQAKYPSASDNYTSQTVFANGYWTINSTPIIYTTSFTVNAACGNGMSFEIYPSQAFTSGTLTTTDWQLELGSVATPYERRPGQLELALCQRYFQKSWPQGTAVGTADGGNGVAPVYFFFAGSACTWLGGHVRYPVELARSPTLTLYDAAGTASRVSWQNGSGVWSNGVTAGNPGYGVNYNGPGGWIGYITEASINSMNCHYTANAEIY